MTYVSLGNIGVLCALWEKGVLGAINIGAVGVLRSP